MMTAENMAQLNASLNGISAFLLFLGWLAIRAKKISLHRACMLGALIVSVAFLVSYLVKNFSFGDHHFQGSDIARTAYLALLASHVVLAVVMLPLIFITLRLALKRKFIEHRKWARRTFPIWSYVSVTGVIIYFVLY